MQSVTDPDGVSTETIAYDTGGYSGNTYDGLPTQSRNALNQCETYGYNTHNMLIRVASGSSSRSLAYDPDDRIGAVGSGDSGIGSSTAYQYVYDKDGRLQTQTEPSSYAAAATISHSYYDDGSPSSLGVSSSAFNQANLYQYSYRADGMLETQAIDDGNVPGVLHPGTTTLSYAYSAAGRATARQVTWPTDSNSQQSTTYDPFGKVQAMQFPGGGANGGSFSDFEYTADGDLLGYDNNGSGGTGFQTYSYDDRGELAQSFYANGVPVPASTNAGTMKTSWDAAMGVPLNLSTTDGAPGTSWEYNVAGQMVTEKAPCCISITSQGGTTYGSQTISRTYDHDNHLLSTNSDISPSNGNVSNNETWGPNSHPSTVAASSSAPAETLHWNADQLLFTTNGNRRVDDVKVGSDGDILPRDSGYNGLTLYGRGRR